MSLKKTIKKFDSIMNFYQTLRLAGRKLFFYLTRKIYRKIKFKTYIKNNLIKKLQLGSGPTNDLAWLKTDIFPKNLSPTLYLDATKPFPFKNNLFSYIYSEHMIEHIHFFQAKKMLLECYRILEPKGKIRLATPDLTVLISLCLTESHTDIQTEYIEWMTNTFITTSNSNEPSHVLNGAFYNHGHKHLYTAKSLELLLRDSGFKNIKQVEVDNSDDPHFVSVESHGKNINKEHLNKFESMVFEAEKE